MVVGGSQVARNPGPGFPVDYLQPPSENYYPLFSFHNRNIMLLFLMENSNIFIDSLPSLGLICFANYERRQIASPHFLTYLIGSPGLPHCSDVSCTYKNCCSGC
ncbi:unnamed protein product [Schistosoma margrebowiei]|uniref:Uncharacterized protein n=1 Tax=Schistosoma margrebowiei TaxID=48269 RepID=A0A183MNF4_9TREM|nr:unnamed protein product [Schistosoma margrebowiei]